MWSISLSISLRRDLKISELLDSANCRHSCSARKAAIQAAKCLGFAVNDAICIYTGPKSRVKRNCGLSRIFIFPVKPGESPKGMLGAALRHVPSVHNGLCCPNK
jgi:hypothetical protein